MTSVERAKAQELPGNRGDSQGQWLGGNSLYLMSTAATLAALGLSRLLFNVVGNRTLGVAIVGKANVLLSLALLSGLPASAGLATAVSRFVPIYGDTIETIRAVRMAVFLTMLSVSLVLLGTISTAWDSGGFVANWLEVAVVATWALLYAEYAVGRSLLFARGQVRRALALELLGLALFGAGLAVTVRYSAAWWLPFGVYPLPVATTALWLAGRRSDGVRFGGQKDFLRFAGLALLGSAAGQGVQYGSTLAGAALGGAAAAGVWATLLSLSAPVLLLPRSLNTTYLPRLSALSKSYDNAFARVSLEHQQLSALIALPATAVLMILGVFGGSLLFPEVPGVDSRQLWTLLCFLTYVMCRSEPILTAIAARGAAGVNASAALVGAAFCALAWYLGISAHLGLLSVCLGLLVYAIVVPTMAAFFARWRGVEGRPRFALQGVDMAALLATGLLLVSRDTRALQLAAILVALLGFLEGALRYSRRSDGGS